MGVNARVPDTTLLPYAYPSIVDAMLIAKMSYASVKNPTPATMQTFTWNQLYHGIHSECLFPLQYQRP